eukprot:7597601-Alexandrium_andersonii.AAC.1
MERLQAQAASAEAAAALQPPDLLPGAAPPADASTSSTPVAGEARRGRGAIRDHPGRRAPMGLVGVG